MKYLDVGVINEVNVDLLSIGAKTRATDGTLFTAAWKVPNALSVAVHFSQFSVPEGGAMYIVSDQEVVGPFTHETQWPAGNLMVNHIKGDQVTVQYFHADAAAAEPIIEVEHVTGAFEDVFAMNSRPCNIQAQCAADETGCNPSCNPRDRSCSIQCTFFDQSPGNGKWMDQSWVANEQYSSVALANASGSRFCSGAFVNNANGDPIVLTAAHCSPSASTLVWHMFKDENCQSTSNNNGERNVIGGARILARSAESDVVLMLMAEANDYTTHPIYLSGYDASDVPSEAVVAIHHPASSNMKVSHSDQSVTPDRWSGTGDPSHWRVGAWHEATTEGGSSGSPLYNRETRRIVGQLHGGSAACPAFNGWDTYGGLYRSYGNVPDVRTVLGEPTRDGAFFSN